MVSPTMLARLNERFLKPEARIILYLYFSNVDPYLTHLANQLELPAQTVFRKLESLTKKGIAQKISKKFYKLTPEGERMCETFLSPSRFSSFFNFDKILSAEQALRPIVFDLILCSRVSDPASTILKWDINSHVDGYVFLNQIRYPLAAEKTNIHTGEWGPLRRTDGTEALADAVKRGVKVTVLGYLRGSTLEQPSFKEVMDSICARNEKNRSKILELFDSPDLHLYVGKRTPDVYHFVTFDASDLYLQEFHAHQTPKRTAFIKNAGKLVTYHNLLFKKLLSNSTRVKH